MKYLELDFEKPKSFGEPPEYFKAIENMTQEQVEAFFNSNIENMRKSMGAPNKNIAKRDINTEYKQIKGYDGDIKIRIYTPFEKNIRPVTVFFHGGGWFGGSLEAVESYCKAYSDKMDHVVISVDYHLAPEFPFPHGLEDCYLAIKWAYENSSSIDCDKDKIYVSGDSAGGNFAAVLSIMARDRNEFKISGQILLYPAVTFDYDSNVSPMGTFGHMVKKWYLSDKVGAKNPNVSPILCADLKNLPKTFIATCEFDPLKIEGKAYGEALSIAENEVKCVMFKNTFHAFIDGTGFCDQVPKLLEEIYDFFN